MTALRTVTGSSAENLFISLFEDVFGAEKTGYLYSQYPFFDIYQDSRFADFLLENGGRRVAIEIDDDASHLPGHVSQVKHYDDLTKQNSMIHMGWAVYRWPVRIMQEQPERVKDELRIFLGSQPQFRAIADYLPTQRGRTFQLKEHQQEALDALAKMREAKETIALIHHATGTGKTVTAVSDAKRMGGRTLYIAHTKDLITQAADTFRELWPEASLGLYVENHKETDAQVICASVQSVALNLDSFLPDAFDYLIIDEAHHAAAETYQKVLAYFTPRFTLGLTSGGAPQIFDLSRRHPRQSRGQLCQRQSCLHAGARGRPGHPRNLQEHSASFGHPDRRGDRRAGAGALHSHPHQHRPDQGALQQRAVQHPRP